MEEWPELTSPSRSKANILGSTSGQLLLRGQPSRAAAQGLENVNGLQDGICFQAQELLKALENARISGIPERCLLIEMSGSHNVQCSEKLFIPHIDKNKLVSWVLTVTSSVLLGPWCQLKQVFTLDPLLPEFSITHITMADHPTQTLPEGCQAWQKSGQNPVLSYQITVQFISGNFGNFYQRLVFDFGTSPKVVRNLGVMVAPETSLVRSLAYEAPCTEESELVWLSKYKLVPFDSSTNIDLSRKEHPLPPNMNSALEYGSFDHMDAVLTPEIYRDRLHTLLFIEEFERRRQMTRLNLHSGDILECVQQSMELPSQSSLVLPVHISLVEDANLLISRSARALVKLVLPGMHEALLFEVVVEALRKDCVVLQVGNELQRVLKATHIPLAADVCFRFVDTYMYMHRAIDTVDLTCVFPSNLAGLSLDWEVAPHAVLNKTQATALSHILDPRPRPPLLMFGPFGTGKTRTIAEAVIELCRLHSGNPAASLRILICTHSNSAADHYIVDYLHPFVTLAEVGNHLCRPLRICWEHRLFSTVSTTVLNYCLIDNQTGKFSIPTREDIDRYSVIVTTLVTADALVKLGLPSGYFSHVFIDEAAQAMEAETLIPLCLVQPSTRVVLAGDHLQLGAYVFSSVARRLALDRSLLVRLYEIYPRVSDCKLLLLENYRAYEDIVEIPSKLFYEGTLVAHKRRPPSSEYPIYFYGVLGREERAFDRASYYNMAEAAEVSERVEELVDKWTEELESKVELNNICVLAPYTAQVREIRQLLRKRQLGKVRVEGVNNVQGLEFDALFISTVHTTYGLSAENMDRQNLGFLSDPRLLNTAVTRAKYHLAIVGDPNALCGAGKSKPCWKTILSKCSEHGTFNYRLPFEKVIKSISSSHIQNHQQIAASVSQPVVLPTVTPATAWSQGTHPIPQGISGAQDGTASVDSIPSRANVERMGFQVVRSPLQQNSSPISGGTSTRGSPFLVPGISHTMFGSPANMIVPDDGRILPNAQAVAPLSWANIAGGIPGHLGRSSPGTAIYGTAVTPSPPVMQAWAQRPRPVMIGQMTPQLNSGGLPMRPWGPEMGLPQPYVGYSQIPRQFMPSQPVSGLFPQGMIARYPVNPGVAPTNPGLMIGRTMIPAAPQPVLGSPSPTITGSVPSQMPNEAPSPVPGSAPGAATIFVPYQRPTAMYQQQWTANIPLAQGVSFPMQPPSVEPPPTSVSITRLSTSPLMMTRSDESPSYSYADVTGRDVKKNSASSPEVSSSRESATAVPFRPFSRSASDDDLNVESLVASLAYNILKRQEMLITEQRWLKKAIGRSSSPITSCEWVTRLLQKQFKQVNKELKVVKQRLLANTSLADLMNVDCTSAIAAAKAPSSAHVPPFQSLTKVTGDFTSNMTVTRAGQHGPQIQATGKTLFPSATGFSSALDMNGENVDFTEEEFYDSDTLAWFQSRQEDPLVQEYIKAFELLMEAHSLEQDDIQTHFYESEGIEGFPEDVESFESKESVSQLRSTQTHDQLKTKAPNWLLQPGEGSFYIGNLVHEDHLDETTIQRKLARFELVLGTLEINGASGGTTGLAKVPDPNSLDILIGNRVDMNRALHSDVVAVEVTERGSLTPLVLPRGKVVFIAKKVHSRNLICAADSLDTNMMTPINNTNPRVIVLQSKDHRGQTGVAVFGSKDGESYCHDFITETSGKLFLVQIMEWGANYRLPFGIVRRCFNEVENPKSASKVFAAEYGIRLNQPMDACREVNGFYPDGWRIAESERESRPCYSGVFTLDGGKSLELDDAISVKKNHDGSFLVGVHIADVSYFIPKGSVVDQAAYVQGTSLYPEENSSTAINMLPSRLSQHLCSLLPGQERLAVSVIFTLNGDGRIIKTPEIHRSIVKSSCSLTFEQCDGILNGQESAEIPEYIKSDILLLGKLTRKISARQVRQGCLSGVSDYLRGSTTSKAAQIVEQLMVMTNSVIAQKILLSERTKDLAPLRRQLSPKTHLMESVYQWCHRNGVVPEGSLTLRRLQEGVPTPGGISTGVTVQPSSLGKISTAVIANDLTLLTESLLECDKDGVISAAHARLSSIQECSQYVVSSKAGQGKQRHFTLGIECYTHFTSPLRRYFDIVVHRCLVALISGENPPYSEQELQEICLRCQVSSMRADAFERSCKSTSLACVLKVAAQWRVSNVERVSADKITVSCKTTGNCKPLNRSVKIKELRPSSFEFVDEEELIISWDVQEIDCTASTEPQTTPLEITDSNQSPDCPEMAKRLVKIPSNLWCSFVLTVAREDLKRIPSDWKNVNAEAHVVAETTPSSLSRRSVPPEVTSSVYQPIRSCTNFYRVGDRASVVLGSEIHKGLLQPVIQGIQVSPTLFCCVHHRRRPEECFCLPLTSPTLPRYSSTDHYQEVMIPLLEVEAATCTLSDDSQMILLRHVTLAWKRGLKNSVEATITLPKILCSPHDLHFSTGDYLCIRDLKSPSSNSAPVTSTQGNILHHARVRHVEGQEDNRSSLIGIHIELTEPANEETAAFLDGHVHQYTVEFIAQSLKHRQMIEAVRNLDQVSDIVRSAVLHCNIPSTPCELVSSVLKGLRLDGDQTEAVRSALGCPLSVIQGQPGTGKTWTAVAIACHFVDLNWRTNTGQVLLCAPTERALDVIAKMILSITVVNVARIYSREAENEALGDTSSQSPVIACCERIALHSRVRGAANPHSDALLVCLSEINKLNQELQKSQDASIREKRQAKLHSKIQKYNAILDTAERFELAEDAIDVILCTCAEAGSSRMRRHSRITQCIVDECNMCLDAEILVPLVTAGQRCSSVVMIGDHKQLVPVLQSKDARKLGLGRSLFESLCEVHAGKNYAYSLLKTQHRMHPSIRSFPSSCFYGSQQIVDSPELSLSTMPMIDDFWPAGQDRCHVFCHVSGQEEVPEDMGSIEGRHSVRFNDMEVQKTVSIVEALVSRGVVTSQICVVTPYVTQRTKLQDALSVDSPSDIQVLLPHDCQGGEKDFVLLSIVRCQSRDQNVANTCSQWSSGRLGCLSDGHQINVVLTRARRGLVIIGDKQFLSTHPMWCRLIADYEALGCVIDDPSWPRELSTGN